MLAADDVLDQLPPAVEGERAWLRISTNFLSQINGNDALSLLCNGVEVDRIGNEQMVADGWTVAGVKAATAEHLLVRKPDVFFGNAGDWETSAENEFDVTPIDDTSIILSVRIFFLYLPLIISLIPLGVLQKGFVKRTKF